MKLEWKQYGTNATWKLKRYVLDDYANFEWAGKVYMLPTVKVAWIGNHQRSGEYQTFDTKEEAMKWVEVIVRMEGR